MAGANGVMENERRWGNEGSESLDARGLNGGLMMVKLM